MFFSHSELTDFQNELLKNQRLLGFDVGSKTIGLSLSDISRIIASPLETIKRSKFSKDAERIINIVDEHSIGGYVIGFPLNMDGSEGPRIQSTRAFARNLYNLKPLPVLFWDERLSTAVVTKTLIEADTSRQRRAELVDKMAATYILQGALDRLSQIGK